MSEQETIQQPDGKANDLGTGSIGKLMVRLAVPSILAQLINALYNIVDRMYIGHMADIGDLALTGVGVTFPIIMLVSAFSCFVGMGGGPLASIEMGKKDLPRASRILNNALFSLLCLAVVLTAGFLAFKKPLLVFFGASEATLPYALDYITIYLCGTVFVMLALGLNAFITAQGFAKEGMMTVLIGAVLNILLDPLFIFAFGMGVRGAALATILSQAVSAIWVLIFLSGKKTILRLNPRLMLPRKDILIPVFSLGIAPFIMQSTESLVMITLNSGLQRYGNDLYVGAMTIISSIMQVATMPMMGLGQGAQPLISYNYGAGKIDRVRKSYRLLILVSFLLSLSTFLILQIFPSVFISIFNNKPELLQVSVTGLRIYFAGMFMMGIQFSCQQCFMAMGQAKTSLFLALLRKIILLIPLALTLPVIFQAVGASAPVGIFVAEPIADIGAATITGLMFLRFIRKNFKKNQEGDRVSPS